MKYAGPLRMVPITDEQIAIVDAYHKRVLLRPATGWSARELTFAYRVRGKIAVHQLRAMPDKALVGIEEEHYDECE